MRSDESDDLITGINVTPLVDITLVLLIVFMVTAKIIVSQSLQVELPKASQTSTTEETLSVLMAADGTVQVDGKPIPSDDELLALAETAMRTNPEVRPEIKADTLVPYGRVIHVVDLLKQRHVKGIRFGVVPVAPAPAR